MTERMSELFEAVVQDPTNRAVSEELEGLLRASEDWTSLVNLYQHLAEHSEVLTERSTWLRQGADIAESSLGDVERAIELLGASVEGADEHLMPTFERLRQLLGSLEQWEGWVQVADTEVQQMSDPADRARLTFEMGRVLEERLNDQERAMLCYQAAFGDDPAYMEALYAARRIYRQHNNWEMVAQLLDLELRVLTDPDRRAEILGELGTVLLYDLEQPESARLCFDELVRLRPDDEQARETLIELGGPIELEGDGQAGPEDAAALLSSSTGETDGLDDDEGDATMMVAPMDEGSGPDAASAFSEGGDLPEFEETVGAEESEEGGGEPVSDEELADVDPGVDASAFDELADVESREGEDGTQEHATGAAPPVVVQDWEDEGGATAEGPVDEVRVDEETAVIEHLDSETSGLESDEPAGADAADRGEESDEGDGDAHLAEVDSGDGDLGDGDSADGDSADGDAADGDAADGDAADGDAADGDADSVSADSASDDEQGSTEEPEEPLEHTTHEASVFVTSAPEFAPAAGSAATLSDAEIDALVSAAEALEGADRLKALTAALVEASNHGAYGSLAALYLDVVRSAPASVEPYWRVGRTLEAPQPTLESIALGLEALAEEDFGGAGVALSAHQLLFGAARLGDAKAVDFKLRELSKRDPHELLFDWNVQRFIETGKWRNAQQLLTDRAGGDPAYARVEGLRQLARLSEERDGDLNRSADFWRQVHQVDKSDREAREALLRLYALTEKWPAYADVLRLEVDDISSASVAEKIEGLQRLAAVYTDHLKMDTMLVQLHEQIVELDPTQVESLDALVEKYEGLRRWPDLIRVTQQKIERSTPLERVELNLRVASLYLERLRNQGEAASVYEHVLELDPDCVEAIEALDGLYEKRRDWDRLVEVRQRLADLKPTQDERVSAYKELAEYANTKIRKPGLCLALWEQVRELAPADPDALRALIVFYEQEKRWEEQVSAIDELVEVAADDSERVELLQKAGIALQDRVGDTAAAVGAWSRLLQIEPEHRRASDSLKKALIDLGDWAGLTAFFAEREKWEELVRLLEGQVGVQKDDETRIDLLFRAADVWDEKLEQRDRAVRALERVLQIEAENLRAARHLEPIYDETGDYRKLAGVIEVLLGHEEDPQERRRLLQRRAQLAEEHLRDPAGALEWTRRLVDEHPQIPELRAELIRLAEANQAWPVVHDDLVTALDRIAHVELDEAALNAQRRAILSELARILDEQIGDLEGALYRFHEILELDPADAAALDAVEVLYTRLARWPELLDIIERKLANCESVEERKALLRKQGQIHEEQLDDPHAAIERYRAILDEDASDPEALLSLHRLYEFNEQHEELHDILLRELRQAESTGDPEKSVRLQLQIGRLELDALGMVPDAIRNLRDLLERYPENAEARTSLEGLLVDPSFRAEVAAILEPIYRDGERWDALVQTLEIQLEETAEAERRLELLERIGTLQTERLGAIDAAFDAFARMLRERPDRAVAIERLTELAEAGDQWETLSRLIEEVLPEVRADELALGLLGRLAAIYEERLDDVDSAIDAHRRVLDLSPEERISIEALDRLYLRSQQWSELLGIYRRKLELAEEPEAREALQFQIAHLLEEMLGESTEAIAVYVEILQLDAENTRALAALDRLYQQEAMWAELADALMRRLALAGDDEERVALQVRLGALHEHELGNLQLAVETYRAVIEMDPDNAASVVALERLIDEPDYRLTVANILEPVYERRDDWERRIGIYEIQCELSPDARRKVELLHRIAAFHQERAGSPEDAFRSYGRAFEVDPSDERTLAQLHRIAEALECWRDLVSIYQSLVYDIDDVRVQTDVHKRAAQVLLDRLGELEEARGHFEAAWENDDRDLQVLTALETIYFQTEQWQELVRVLLRRSELTEEIGERKDLLFRVSAIYEEMLEDPEQAVSTFQDILEVDPVDARALEALERIYLGLERWEDLMEVLHKKAGLTEDITARKDIFYVIGATYERELDDLMRAVETYNTVLEWDAVDATSLQSLDRLFERLEHWEDLLGILRREVALADDRQSEISIRYRIARLQELHLGAVGEAISGYRALLEDEPGHEPTLQALEGLIRDDREAVVAAETIEPFLVRSGAWERLIAVWADLIEVSEETSQRFALRMRIGQALEDMIADGDRAFVAYGAAFREVPADETALVALERVTRAREEWPALIELIESELPAVNADETVVSLLKRVARVFEVELGDAVEAIERFRRVHELDPQDEGAVLALDRLYQRAAMWPDLGEILRIRVEREEGEARVPLLLRLGALQESLLDQVIDAIETFKEVLAIIPGEPEAIEALERVFDSGHEQPVVGEILEPFYEEGEQWEKLHGMLEALLAHVLPGEDRVRALHRLAVLCEGQLGSPERAFGWYGRAFQEAPEFEGSRDEVGRLAESLGSWAELAGVYRDGIGRTQDLELITSVGHEMAEIYRRRLEDEAAAEQMYRYLLDAIDASDVKALGGVDSILVGQERWEELVEILEREIAVVFEDEPRARLIYRLGELFESRLGELDRAVDQFRSLLDIDPHHGAALQRLEHIHLSRQEWQPLFEVFSRQSEAAAEDDVLRASLLARMATLASEFLERPTDAIDLWAQVIEVRGEDPEALMALEGLYQAQESWRELVDVCERQVTLLDNDVDREIQLFSKLGRVWGDYLDRERNALENWEKVLDRAPDSIDAVAATRDLYERLEEHPEVARWTHRLLELVAPDDPQRADLFRALGRLYQETLSQPADAIAAWVNLLALSGHDREAIDALEELYTEQQDWAACVEILDRKVEITEDVYERISILFRVAEMFSEALEDASGAQSAYARILELQPDNLDAFRQLEGLYERGEQWQELVDLLLRRLDHTSDPQERLDLLVRVGSVFESHVGSPEHAFLVLSQAFQESRDDERFGDELERLAEAEGKWAELIGLYEAVLQPIMMDFEAIALHLRVARLYDTRLEQAQHAGTHYQYVLSIDPNNVDALAALENLLERFENWPKVVEVLRRKIEIEPDPENRQSSLVKLARILESHLDLPDEAIEAYQQVLLIDPSDLETLQALERLYALRQRWVELAEILEQETTALTDPVAVVETYLRVGEMYETRLASPERAIDAYRQALVTDESCIDAMEALEKLYMQQDRWHELLDVYEMFLRVRTSPGDQLRYLAKCAMIQEEELSDVYSTIETYRKMVDIDAREPAAVKALDRLYRDGQQFEELAEIYERHLASMGEGGSQSEVRLALAEIYRDALAAPERAISTLEPVLEAEPENGVVLRTLGDLYEAIEDWHRCIDARGREAHLLRDRAELLQRQFDVGRIYQQRLGDLDQAERWFRGALEHDPNFVPALDALREIAEARGDWKEVVRTLKMMEAATRQFPEKSRHLFKIGEVYAEHLQDRLTAIDFFEQAMDLHPENVAAAMPLVEVYWEEQRWERAEPLFELVLASKQDAEPRELQDLHFRLAHCAEHLQKDEKAINHYRQAYELDSTHLPTLRGMGNLLFRNGHWDRAFKIYQTILVHHRESLESPEVVDVFFRQGDIKLKVGERRKALDFFRKALDLDPLHAATLQAIVDLHTSQGDWEDVVHYRRQMQPMLADATRQFENLVTVGDVLHEQLRNTRMAVATYNEALELQPGSKLVLNKLLDIHQSAKNWSDAVSVLEQFVGMEQDPVKKAKFLYAAGAIQRDYLKDTFTAVRTFDRALDADPSQLKAFQAIDQILTQERDYERQDRYYRKMLKRATENQLDDKLVVTLAVGLGEINRSRLERFDEAIKAYKIAQAKAPDNPKTLQILAELYELESQVDKAIAQHYRLIELEPRSIESYQHLRRLFMDAGRFDEAWCVCQVLTFMGQASADEQGYFEKYRSRTLAQARRPLDPQHWALLSHPEKSALLDRLLALLYRFSAPLMLTTHKDLRLHKKKDLIDPHEQTPFNNVLGYAANITRLQRLEAYRDPQGRPGIRAVNLNPPAMLVGADVTSGPKLQELAFLCAKSLYLIGQQQHFLAAIDETYEQRKARLFTMVYTLMKLVTPDSNVPFFDESLLEAYRQIPALELQEMGKLLAKMSANHGHHLNLSKWLEMTEHSANRLGLVLSNDISSAIQVIRNEPGQFSRASTPDRIREVVLFALSDNYFQLRKALGLAIGTGA